MFAFRRKTLGGRSSGHLLVVAFLTLAVMAAAMCMTGCAPPASPQPARYNVRETDNGVYIFEYDAGNQGENSGDSLTLFTDSLNVWTQANPQLGVTRLERLSTTVNYTDTQRMKRSVTVVNVLVYTKPSGKPPLPKPPEPKPAVAAAPDVNK